MTTAEIIHRKSATQRLQVSDGTLGADRAFRLGLGKAARDELKIQLEVEKLSIDRRSVAELVELVPDFALIAILNGPSAELGAIILSQTIVAGFIEAQTIGRVRGQDLLPRKPTRTDGAMVSGVIDSALSILEQSLSDTADIVWAGGFRCASFLEDPRPLPVVLEDAPLRVLTADVSLAGGLRKGKIYLALPAEGHTPLFRVDVKAGQDDVTIAFGAALQDRVDGANVQLDAVLARISLPMDDVLNMAQGMIVPLQDAALDMISIEGADGRCVALGKLGQNRGMRALRLVDIQTTILRKGARAGRVLNIPYQNAPVQRGALPVSTASIADRLGLSAPSLEDAAQSAGAGEEVDHLYELRSTGTH